MSRKINLIKNTILLGVGTLLPRLAAFVTLPVLTGVLTREEYGTYDLITVLVALYLPAVTLQLQAAGFRFLVEHRDNEEEIRAVVTNIFAFLLPAAGAGLLVLWFFLPASNGIRALVCFYFASDILVNNLRQMARGLGRNNDYSISAGLASIGSIVFVFLFVFVKKWGLSGAVLALSLSAFISALIIACRLKIASYIRFRCVSIHMVRQIISYSWPMVPNYMSMWIMRLSDRFVVSAVLGVAANAVYAAANKIPSLLNVFQSAFTLAWQENAIAASSDQDVSAYYSEMFDSVFNLTAGFLGLLISATPLLFALLIRGDYGEAYQQIPILYMAALFYAMATFLGGIYVAYMKTKSVGMTTAMAAAVNFLTDILLIKRIGLYAASGSTLVSYLFLLVFRMIDIQRIVKIRYRVSRVCIITLVLAAECILCFRRTAAASIINVLLAVICFYFANREVIHRIRERFRKQTAGAVCHGGLR